MNTSHIIKEQLLYTSRSKLFTLMVSLFNQSRLNTLNWILCLETLVVSDGYISVFEVLCNNFLTGFVSPPFYTFLFL